MREYSGLGHLRGTGSSSLYCPKCGNYLEVVMNGWFHGELFFCPKEKRVFCVLLKDITKGAGEEYIKSCVEDTELKQIRRKITKKNYKQVDDIIKKIEGGK